MTMIKPNQYLVNRIKEVFTEGKWVTGTNFKEQIYDLNWNDAVKKVEDLHTIAELTFHINYYISGVIQVLEGGPLEIRDKFSFDSPPIKSEKDWKKLINKFCSDSEKFISLVENMTEEELFSIFVDEKYGDYYRNIDVMMEHTYYHLGQILLIKKLIKK